MKVWPADTFVARRLAPWLLHSDPCTCNPSQSYPYPAEAVLRSLFNRYRWNPWELKINSLKTGAKLDLNGFEERLCSCSMHIWVQLWVNLTFKYWQKDISMDQWQRWWRRLKLWSTIKRVKSAILHSIYRVKRSPQPARLVWCRSADGAGGGGSKKSQMINNLSAVFIPSHTTKPSSAGCWFMPNDLFFVPSLFFIVQPNYRQYLLHQGFAPINISHIFSGAIILNCPSSISWLAAQHAA